MSALVLGFDHSNSSEEVRRQVALTSDQIPYALHQLNTKGAMILSTCNRTEVLFDGDSDKVLAWFGQKTAASPACHPGVERVSEWCAGMASAVLGEAEIVAQVKQAHQVAGINGALTPELDRLVRHGLNTGKKVRSLTDLTRGVMSYAVMATREASARLGGFEGKRVLVIGAGEMGERIIRELGRTPPKQLVVASRTNTKAEALAKTYGCQAIAISQVSQDYDAVFGCASSLVPLSFPRSVVIDLGVPPVFARSDVGMEVFVQRALSVAARRKAALTQGRAIIEEAAMEFKREEERRQRWRG